MTFPSDEVLLARGKYATLGSERRALLKTLRDDMETVADCARRVLRHVDDDLPFSQESAAAAHARANAAIACLVKLAELAAAIEALKPTAWGKTKETE